MMTSRACSAVRGAASLLARGVIPSRLSLPVNVIARVSTNPALQVQSTSWNVMSVAGLPSRRGMQSEVDHTPTANERRILVWSGMYANYDDIPETVSRTKMRKAKDKMRVRVNLMMILATAVAAVCMIFSGRAARDRGESVEKMNLGWHKNQKVKND